LERAYHSCTGRQFHSTVKLCIASYLFFNWLDVATPFHRNTVLKLLCEATWQAIDSEEVGEGFTVAQPKIAKDAERCLWVQDAVEAGDMGGFVWRFFMNLLSRGFYMHRFSGGFDAHRFQWTVN
jgi:hypothetical protein